MRKLHSWIAAAFLFVLAAIPGRSLAGELGFGIQVEATEDATPAQLAANRELWFAASPGETATRAIRIISTSPDPQLISIAIFPLVVVDGEDTLVSSEPSEIDAWASIEPNGFIVEPRAQQTVQIRITPPPGSEGSYTAYVVVSASGPNDGSTEEREGTYAIVPTALTFSKSLWLGVGDGQLPETDFELRGVAARRDGETKFLQVQIENTGGTPIRPKGEMEVVDPLFPDNRFGPLEFSFATILPGETRRTEIEAPAELEDGNWRVRVVARQGSIQKSEIYDVTLTFDDSTSEFGEGWRRLLRLPWLRFGLPLIALVGVVFGWRLMRGKRDHDPPAGDSSSGDTPLDGPPKDEPPTPTNGTATATAPRDSDAAALDDTFGRPVEQSDSTPSTRTGRIIVHVSGAVRNPGMFEVNDDARVGEVIERAGGTLIVAETEGINLARRVTDGEQIVVPKRVVAPRDSRPIAIPEILDLNLANAEQLAALPGIGHDIGVEIVAHRRRIGRFTAVDQLLEVKGIGPRKLAVVKRRLRV
jgi:DNA uptake protein ComE-like DNA-binding protein